tara:strand:- start:195 stop:920 length:726 start_codon:yes stop_codon:yes gene_type:complete
MTRISLIIGMTFTFLQGFGLAVSAEENIKAMPIIMAIKETESTENRMARLGRIDNLVEKYKLNLNEKYIYTGEGLAGSLHNLGVVYKISDNGSSSNVIQLNFRNGFGRKKVVANSKLIPEASLSRNDYNQRIASRVILKDEPGSKARKYYKDWYDEYFSLRATLAKKVLDTGRCDTVVSADMYLVNGNSFTAFCGNGFHYSQNENQIRNDKPLDSEVVYWTATGITVPDQEPHPNPDLYTQ